MLDGGAKPREERITTVRRTIQMITVLFLLACSVVSCGLSACPVWLMEGRWALEYTGGNGSLELSYDDSTSGLNETRNVYVGIGDLAGDLFGRVVAERICEDDDDHNAGEVEIVFGNPSIDGAVSFDGLQNGNLIIGTFGSTGAYGSYGSGDFTARRVE
jgi:hypothetical protein